MVNLDIIKDIVQTKPGSRIRPREFFIAWEGVPTLAYQGFSNTLLEIKEAVTRSVPGLKPENPGSRWAKTTLGTLKDNVKLTLKDVYELRRICTDLQADIDNAGTVFDVNSLSVVVFACRSLEKRLATCRIEFNQDLDPDDEAPPAFHLSTIDRTLAQFSPDRLSEYIPDLQKAGGRESEYRSALIQATLVFDLPDEKPAYIERFTAEVNEMLPGRYAWFDPKSYHMTIRALV
ncbi:MAG: hypothetical protein JRJ15_00535 [Deltaproteobacteria bacterium]|nr:hypothetical protein [Deltaproteobacteria bacterium]